MVSIRMGFDDFSTKEFLTQLPLGTTVRRWISTARWVWQRKRHHRKSLYWWLELRLLLWSADHDDRFIAPCKGDAGPSKFLHYDCIRHQQATWAKVIGFGHVMTPGVKVLYSIGSDWNNTGCNTRLLEELSAECGDTEWTPEHALFTDICGKLNHFNCDRRQM